MRMWSAVASPRSPRAHRRRKAFPSSPMRCSPASDAPARCSPATTPVYLAGPDVSLEGSDGWFRAARRDAGDRGAVRRRSGRMIVRKHSFTDTHSPANPIACAAALASLALLDDRCAERRQAIEREHTRAAAKLCALPGVSERARPRHRPRARYRGGRRGYLSEVGPALRRFALDNGVLLRPLGNTAYVLPPYCSTAADLARAYDVIAEFVARRGDPDRR